MSEFTCAVCNISLCSITSYRNHCSSKSHIVNVNNLNKKNNYLTLPKNTPNTFICNYCEKSYCNKSNLTRHKTTCAELLFLKDKYAKNLDKIIDNDIEMNRLVKTTNNINNPSSYTPNITINIQQNITNNNNNTANITNNNNTANVVNNNIELKPDDIFNNFWNQANIRPMGFEDLSGLDTQEVADKVHGFGLNCFVEFINQLYKNELNHNIALYNKREKLVKYIHKSGEVKIDSLPSVMSSVLMNLVDYLDKYLDRTDIEIKKQYLPVINKLRELHALEENPQLDRYNTHLYNRLLNITKSSLDKIKEFEQKINNELCDSLKELTLNIPSTDSRTEPDITSVNF